MNKIEIKSIYGDVLFSYEQEDNTVKQTLLKEAKRTNSVIGRKCRAEFITVLELFGEGIAVDKHTGKVLYKVGETVRPDKYDDSLTTECTNGIHFFITREEAEAY